LIERLPALEININHLGAPPVPSRGWDPWASQMARAAQHRNASVKLSVGGDLASKWQWSSDDLRRYTDHVLSAFGADRVIAASNWPVCLLAGSFAQVWDGLNGLIAPLAPLERQAVLGGSAMRIFGLRRSATSA
jgi:L-fuconolactonase